MDDASRGVELRAISRGAQTGAGGDQGFAEPGKTRGSVQCVYVPAMLRIELSGRSPIWQFFYEQPEGRHHA